MTKQEMYEAVRGGVDAARAAAGLEFWQTGSCGLLTMVDRVLAARPDATPGEVIAAIVADMAATKCKPAKGLVARKSQERHARKMLDMLADERARNVAALSVDAELAR